MTVERLEDIMNLKLGSIDRVSLCNDAIRDVKAKAKQAMQNGDLVSYSNYMFDLTYLEQVLSAEVALYIEYTYRDKKVA